MADKDKYTGITVSHDARDALRKFQAIACGWTEARLTMSDALIIAIKIATDKGWDHGIVMDTKEMLGASHTGNGGKNGKAAAESTTEL